ncbi:MAG: hypothetical protein QM656_04690 [Paracoccaceae bacterium]
MTVKPKPQWRKGWSRALSVDPDKPVTLHRAPWETCNRAATPQPKEETDGA